MLIVRDISTNVVVAISEAEPVFDDSGCQIGDVLMLGVTADLHEIVEGDPPTLQFAPGMLTFADGVWDVADGDAYAAAIEQIYPFDAAKAMRVGDVQALVAAKLAAGAAVDIDGDTYHVAVTDGSRADIGSMATNAIATIVTSGAAPWLDAYILGWITIENVRKPLLTPTDGLALASAIAAFYADTRQHGRTLKDAILAAADLEALDAIDVENGWPA